MLNTHLKLRTSNAKRAQFKKSKKCLVGGRINTCQGSVTQTRQATNTNAWGEGSVSIGKLRQTNRESTAKC